MNSADTLHTCSSGSTVQLAQDRTTHSSDAGANRLVPQNASGSQECAHGSSSTCLSGNPCELKAEDGITGGDNLKQTSHTELFTHTYLEHQETAKCLSDTTPTQSSKVFTYNVKVEEMLGYRNRIT